MRSKAINFRLTTRGESALRKYLHSGQWRWALWCRDRTGEDSIVRNRNPPRCCWSTVSASAPSRAWTICGGRLSFYAFALGMSSADARTHPPTTMFLSASVPTASTISRPTTHASLTGIDFGRGRRRDRLVNPEDGEKKIIFGWSTWSVIKLLTLRIILLCSDRDFVFWKCSRFFLNASSSNLSFSSSSSPNEMCTSFKFDFFAIFANSLISSANGFDASSVSMIGLNVPCFCFWSFGELEMLSVDVSMTTVSRLVDVVEFESVPSAPWLTRL